MLRLLDARTGHTSPAGGTRPGTLSILLTAAAAAPVRLTDLRASLVTDLIRRVSELRQLQVSAWQSLPRGAAESGRALRAAWADLNVYPLEFTGAPPGSPDVWVAAPGTGGGPGAHSEPRAGAAGGTLLVHTGQVSFAGAGEATLTTTGISARGLDPLAFRLAFLSEHYRKAAGLTWQNLEAADQALRQWRKLVADWASEPSQPVNGEYLREVIDAVDADLDTAAALDRLRTLITDDGVAPGSKFETFAYLDRLLGLDLAREVGR